MPEAAARLVQAPRRGDVWGGLAAMLVALPAAIGFGVIVFSAIGPGFAVHGALAGIVGTVLIGLIASGLDQFAFSFDGFDAETYERTRVNGEFEKTLGNIVRFLEIKKELGARKPVTLIELIDMPGLRESAARS